MTRRTAAALAALAIVALAAPAATTAADEELESHWGPINHREPMGWAGVKGDPDAYEPVWWGLPLMGSYELTLTYPCDEGDGGLILSALDLEGGVWSVGPGVAEPTVEDGVPTRIEPEPGPYILHSDAGCDWAAFLEPVE